MKSAIFASAFIALTSTIVAADDSDCWMTLGAYSTGGTYCVAPLPDFNDQAGCQNAHNVCTAEYSQCTDKTQSPSACLQLFMQCNIISTFCDNQCKADANGNTASECDLDTAKNWDGVTMPTPTPIAPAVVMTQSVIANTAKPVAYNTPVVVANNPVAYNTPVATKAAPTPVASAALIAPDVPCGQCFNDGTNKKRGLSVQKYAPYGTPMTIGTCMKLCQGYKYSGLEYSSECFCGNSFLNGATPAYGSQCNMPCQGDKSTVCGASWLMNIWQQGCVPPVTPVKSTAAPYVAPVVKSTPAFYNPTPAKVTSTPVAHASVTPTVGICSIPAAYATPVGGYHAPIVACNDLSDYKTSPWKLYNTHATSNAPVYAQGATSKACTDACSYQYNSCTKDYAASLNTYSSYSGYKVRRGASVHAKRTWWLYGAPSVSTNTYAKSSKDTYSTAMSKCANQRSACVAANSNINVKGTCGANGVYTAPGTGLTYNSGTNSYGSYNTGNTYSSSSSYGGSATDNDQYWKQ